MTDMKKDEIYQMDYIGLMNEMQADVPRIIFVSQQGAASRKKVWYVSWKFVVGHTVSVLNL